MFWTSDAYSTRRTHSIDSSSLRYTSKQLENDDKNHQLQTKNNQDKINLSEKVSKFLAVNKQHQFDQVCVCEDCIYAKQLNRYQALKMDLSKMSSYRAQYNKNHLKKNFSNTENLKDSSISKKPEDGNMSKNPYVHIDSVYKNEYASRSLQKVQKPRPSDQLKFTGPSTSFSSYKALYPNINGPYQYMQPSKQQALPNLKFKAQSLYTNDFKGNRVVETESAKINDQLKLGKPSLIKQSTNKRQFSNPQNSFIMSDRYNSSRQRRLQTPNFSFQYKTINRDEFEKPASKKNCRNKRMQILHGQMLASQNMSTIA